MTHQSTTIWEAARDRFAEWAFNARSQDGSRSLPGSRRKTEQDIWSATETVATDKSRCGTAMAVTARLSREDVFSTDRWQSVRELWEVWRPTPTSLTYVSSRGSPRGGSTRFNLSHVNIGKTERRAARQRKEITNQRQR